MSNQKCRLDQLLSTLGYGSRKEVRQWVKDERITDLSGVVIEDSGAKVDPATVMYDGEPLDYPLGIFIMLHKPAGYVCSHTSNEGPTIYDLLPEQWHVRRPQPSSIGRLDKDTTGVILITDNGPLNHRLTSPRSKVIKVYEVTTEKPLSDKMIELLQSGTIVLEGDDEPVLPATCKPISDCLCRFEICEGKYHQVKRMFAAAGAVVVKLHRIQFGEYHLGELGSGEYIELSLPK